MGSSDAYTYYAGNYVYNGIGSGSSLKFFNHPEGYVDTENGYKYVYQYKDHLGNVRLSYSDTDNDGAISEAGIFNDGFESTSGWGNQGSPLTVYDNTFKHSGAYSAKMVKTTSGEMVTHSNTWISIDNSVSTNYIISGWVYSDGPSADLFLFMNEDGETGYFTYVSSVRTYTTNQWVYLEKTVGVPANVDKLNIRIDNNGGGTVWFDDVKIRKEGSEILEENNYYPFGLKHKGYNTIVNSTNPALKYKFGGKEYQDELGLGWYDITARNYDPALGRWMNLDPLAEKMRRHSPYNYAFDNPVFFIDPDGMMPYGPGDPPWWKDRQLFGRAVQKLEDKLNAAYNKVANFFYNDGESFNAPSGSTDSSNPDMGGFSLIDDSGDASGSQDFIRTGGRDTEVLNVEPVVDNVKSFSKVGRNITNADGKTNATTRSIKSRKNSASKMNKNVKDFQKGFKNTQKWDKGAQKLAGTLNNTNTDGEVEIEYSVRAVYDDPTRDGESYEGNWQRASMPTKDKNKAIQDSAKWVSQKHWAKIRIIKDTVR